MRNFRYRLAHQSKDGPHIIVTDVGLHHTPVVENPEPKGWGVLELASRDLTRGICGLFQLSAPSQPEYVLRLRGLDVGKQYRVTFDSSGQSCVVAGYALMKQGITVRLESALTSELLIFEAVDAS